MLGPYITSLIRTLVPAATSAAITWLIVRYDLVLDEGMTAEIAVGTTAAVFAMYYAAARWLEQRNPKLGALLGSTRQPDYRTADERTRDDAESEER